MAAAEPQRRRSSTASAAAVVDERIERHRNIRDSVQALQEASVSASAHMDGWCSRILEMAEAYESIAGQLDDSNSATLISDVQKLVEFSHHAKTLGDGLKQRLGDVQTNARRQMGSNEQALRKFEAAAESETDRQKIDASLMMLSQSNPRLKQVKNAERALADATELSRKNSMAADQADLEACTSARRLLFEGSFNELTEGLQHFYAESTVSLMGVQPIEKPRVSHHEGQTALQDLRVFATTFNVGDRLPSNEDMQYWLPPDLLERHHILAFALQEAAVESGHDDEPEEEAAVAEEAASDAASSSRRDPRNDPMEYKIQQYLEGAAGAAFRQLPQTLTSRIYKGQLLMSRPSIRLHLFVRATVFDRVHSVQVEAVNTGYTGVFNKGAVVCCLNFDATSLVFVSSHLAAHEGTTHCQRRNADVASIMKAAKKNIRCPKLSLEATAQHIFWLGDLNYRVGMLSGAPADADCRAEVHRSIVRRDYAAILQGDELKLEQEAGRVFSGYETPDPTFPPTFKVRRGSADPEYNPRRTPSYTDRILVHSLPGAQIATDSYEAVFACVSSDHKPVRGSYTISGRRAHARLRTFVPREHRPMVLFRSITVHLNDAHSCAAREVVMELHADPWWAHGYHGYLRCLTESKPVSEGGIHFDFRQGPREILAKVSPEAEFRIESLEGTHLFLCLVDPSKRAPSESGLGQAVLSMDAVRAAADGSRPWNLDLYSDGVVIGKMRVELEIKNWGEAASDAERRLKELHTLLRSALGPDKAAIVNEIKELMELGKKGPVMATVVPGLADQPLVCTQCKFDNSGKPLALACEMCGGILGVDGGDGGIAIGGGAGADDGCGGSSLAPNGPHPDLEPPPPPPPTTERLISYDAAQAPLVAQPYVAPLAINASQYLVSTPSTSRESGLSPRASTRVEAQVPVPSLESLGATIPPSDLFAFGGGRGAGAGAGAAGSPIAGAVTESPMAGSTGQTPRANTISQMDRHAGDTAMWGRL